MARDFRLDRHGKYVRYQTDLAVRLRSTCNFLAHPSGMRKIGGNAHHSFPKYQLTGTKKNAAGAAFF
jgi:hypothetical protein